MPRLDVLCVGRACVDEILEVPSYPEEDSKIAVTDRLREGGGQASTAACLIAHLGGHAAFVGRIGTDAAGEFCHRRMADCGVDLSWMPNPRGTTPTATCVVSRATGSRTIIYERLADKPLVWEELVPALEARPRVVLADPQCSELLPRLSVFCRSLRVLLVADAERAASDWPARWGTVDVLAASREFLRQAAPGLELHSALAEIDRHGPGWSCVTLGAEGCLLRLDGSTHHVAATSVAVRDTTGAGDSFHGALALALARGLEPLDAAHYATVIAGLCCRGLGGRSFPEPVEVEQYLDPSLQNAILSAASAMKN